MVDLDVHVHKSPDRCPPSAEALRPQAKEARGTGSVPEDAPSIKDRGVAGDRSRKRNREEKTGDDRPLPKKSVGSSRNEVEKGKGQEKEDAGNQLVVFEDTPGPGDGNEGTSVGEGEFDFHYRFQGDGKHICQLPSACVEFMRCIQGSETRKFPPVEDLVDRSGYIDISTGMVRVMTDINFMALRYNNILVKCNGLVEEKRALAEEKAVLEKEVEELRKRPEDTTKIAEEKAKWAEERSRLVDESRILKEKLRSQTGRMRKMTDDMAAIRLSLTASRQEVEKKDEELVDARNRRKEMIRFTIA